MSQISTTPPPAQTESNTARKKREKAEQAAKTATGTATPTNGVETEGAAAANGEQSSDNPYVKELQKQVRNINKKLNSSAKVDSIIAENPKSSLDELLAAKKINADQKAQALKKPGLQAQLAQLEEQLAQYRKIDNDYQTRFSSERQAAEDKHSAELSKIRETTVKEAEANTKTVVKQKLLLFSQFLRAAAAKRVIEEEADTEESKAFEGALLLVYGGDDKAVQAAENIVEGADDFVPSVEGQALSIKYSQLKELTLQHAPYIPDGQWADAVTETNDAVAAEASHINVDTTSDPTITNAGLTELGIQQSATEAPVSTDSGLPAQLSAGDESANKAAGRTWDNAGPSAGPEGSEESFEMVPRDPTETETPHAPAAVAQTNSWADDSAEAAANAAATSATTPAPVDNNDGFHEVQGRRGGHRGHRGDGEGRGRGRGRGGFRGGDRGRGGFRGDRRGGGEHRGGEHRGGEHRGGRGRGQPRGSS
ncbi:hypothetical protein ANO11243_016140 [Dothideomycetidae sp. 11243]|nr:hypothetical protein ANO11243_016140 [fungal sp. No.11243]